MRLTVQLQPHQFYFPLKPQVANYLLSRLHIYKPTQSPHVCCTKAGNLRIRTSLASADVSWRTLMGYPSYARNRACALPSPSPFHYVMAKKVPSMELAAYTKSSTLYGRS